MERRRRGAQTGSRVQEILRKYSNEEEDGEEGGRRTFSVCARGVFFSRARFLNSGRALRCFDALGAVSGIKEQLSEIELETANNIKGIVC